MRNLKTLPIPVTIEGKQELQASITIFEKIEFSGITKEQIAGKLKYLREVQVPQREVLLDMADEDVVFYWFKNWLHPALKHYFKLSPWDKRGCSRKVLENDMQNDSLHNYENGQQNYDYTLADIEAYIKDAG